MTSVLLKIMAPITTFLSEEAYAYFKGKTKDSVFLEEYPEIPKSWFNPEIAHRFELALKTRTEVQKKLEELRAAKVIGASLEAYVEIHQEGDSLKALSEIQDLREFLIVSKVSLKSGPAQISVQKSDGEKCDRCWIYSNEIGAQSEFPGICPKCVEALK
jgi:isoleucyl-tRNA synthetase